jgi:hypothetical protein
MVADLEDEVKAMDPDANEYSEEGATAMLKKLAAMKKKVKNQIDGGRKFVFFSLSHLSPSLSYFRLPLMMLTMMMMMMMMAVSDRRECVLLMGTAAGSTILMMMTTTMMMMVVMVMVMTEPIEE